MVTTPWELHDRFSQMLQSQTARDQAIGAGLQQDQFAAELGRQNATTAFGRNLMQDQINFQQQSRLADEQRAFTHDENKLINVDYKLAAKGDRRSIYGRPTKQTPAGGTGQPITPQYAYQHLTSGGMPPIVAAGLVGNISAESGWDPRVFSGERRGDGGTAFGSGQWRHERQAHLFEYAQANGHPFPTVEDQLDFYYEEAQSGRDPGARKAFDLAAQAQTPEEAAQVIMDYYERPKDQSSSGHRQQAARQVYEEFGGQSAPSSDPSVGAGGSGGGMPDTTQRRYVGDPPSTQVQDPAVQTTTGTPDMQETGYDLPTLDPWTDEDLAAAGVTAFDTADLPDGFDVVGIAHYSGAQVDRMPSEMKDRLIPLGSPDVNGTNEYLLLMPRENGIQTRDPTNDLPVYTQPNTIGGGSAAPETPQPQVAPAPVPQPGQQVQNAPLPGAINAPPIAVSQETTAGVQGPAQPNAPVSNAPTGQRTRRAPDGTLEFLVDGQWRPSGG